MTTTRTIRFACIDSDALPLFAKSTDGVTRTGYEASVAELLCNKLGVKFEWVMMPWEDMIPSVRSGETDAVLCGQGVIPERQALVDFTEPYTIFNETLVVREGITLTPESDYTGHKIGAIAGSTNMKLAETFKGAELVPFGSSDDVFQDMIDATRSGQIHGFVDDDVVMIPLAQEAEDLSEAFTVKTANRWAIGVKPGNQALLDELNGALTEAIADGSLKQIWDQWLSPLEFPFTESE